MNKRFFLALILTAIVIVATPLLFSSTKPRPSSDGSSNSSRDSVAHPRDTVVASVPATVIPAQISSAQALSTPIAVGDTATVKTPHAVYTFNAKGATAISVVLDSYPSLRPDMRGKRAQLIGRNDALAQYRLVLDRDTVALDTVAFQIEKSSTSAAQVISFAGTVAGHGTKLTYSFSSENADRYLVGVSASVANAPA